MGGGEGECEYVVRAKRLNVYPDAVELVWFDDKELDNSTYALWVAAQDPGGSGSTASLCTWQEATAFATFPDGHYKRAFVTDPSNPVTVEFD